MTETAKRKLSPRAVAAEMWAVYRSHWRFLVPAAVVILVPQAVVDGILEANHVEHIRELIDVATIGVTLLTAAVNLLGQAIYAGLTAAAVVDWRAGRPLPPTSALIRSLPIWRLIVLDLVVTLGTAVGFVLLVVPALIFLTYVSASAPVLKLEHLSVRAALRRSIELVLGNARRVFVIVIGAFVFTETAVQLIAAPFGDTWLLVLVNLLGEAIFQPIEGLAVAIVAIRLLELHGQAPAPEEMVRALVPEHG